MILDSMKVDFRKFNNKEIHFGKKITVISGYNGTMKTTILGLIGQLFAAKHESKDSTFPNPDILFEDVYGEVPDAPFRKNMRFSIPEHDPIGKPECHFKFSNKSIGENGKYSYNTTWRNSKNDPDNKWRVWNIKGKSARGLIKDIPVYFFQLDRLFPICKSKRERKIKNVDLTCDEKKLFNKLYYEIFRNIKDEIVGHQAMKVDNIKNIPGVKFNNRNHDTISAGEDNISQIIYSIISMKRIKNRIEKFCHKKEEFNKKDYYGGIILIDELDSSLHPPAQKNLFNVLNKYSKKFKIQFIFTTHSTKMLKHAYKRQKNTLKDKATSNDIIINYLQPKGNQIDVIKNPRLSSILQRLNLDEDEPKLQVLVEDNEAKQLLELFLNNKIIKKIKINPLNIGCSEIIRLLESNTLKELNNSIIVLDGDVKEGKTRKKFLKLSNQRKNVIALPGNTSPEAYIMDFLDDLNDNHPFWGDFDTFYSKNYYNQHCISKEKRYNKNSRNINKKWWKNNYNYWNKTELSNALHQKCLNKKSQLLENLKQGYNIIASKALIPKIKFNINTKTNWFNQNSESPKNDKYSSNNIYENLEEYLKTIPKSVEKLTYIQLLKIMQYLENVNYYYFSNKKDVINNHFEDSYSKNFIKKFHKIFNQN